MKVPENLIVFARWTIVDPPVTIFHAFGKDEKDLK